MAKATADSTGGVIISVDSVHYAVMTEDSTDKTKPPVYGAIKPLPNAKTIGITANDTATTNSYDGKPKIVYVAKGERSATFTKSDFADEDMAAMLGQEIVNNVIVDGEDSSAPYIALMFRLETTKGHRYYAALKGMMTVPPINGATKEVGSVTFQDQTITGSFIMRDFDGACIIQKHLTGEDDTQEAADAWFSATTLTTHWKNASAADPGSEG